jgi:hypothetical protein
MAYNVPAVTDVFLRPIRKNAKHFYGRKKMWRRKTAQRALAQLRFFVARAAEGGDAVTVLLCEGCTFISFFYTYYTQLFCAT